MPPLDDLRILRTPRFIVRWPLLGFGVDLQDVQATKFFPTCQVRVVRFYKSCPSFLPSFLPSSLLPPSRQTSTKETPPQRATTSVYCRTSTASMRASVRRRTSTASRESHCSLPDLYRKHARPVFGAGPPPRAANPIVRCRTSTASMHAQCSAPDLHREQRIPLFAAGPLPQACTPSVRRRTSTASIKSQCSLPDLNHFV